MNANMETSSTQQGFQVGRTLLLSGARARLALTCTRGCGRQGRRTDGITVAAPRSSTRRASPRDGCTGTCLRPSSTNWCVRAARIWQPQAPASANASTRSGLPPPRAAAYKAGPAPSLTYAGPQARTRHRHHQHRRPGDRLGCAARARAVRATSAPSNRPTPAPPRAPPAPPRPPTPMPCMLQPHSLHAPHTLLAPRIAPLPLRSPPPSPPPATTHPLPTQTHPQAPRRAARRATSASCASRPPRRTSGGRAPAAAPPTMRWTSARSCSTARRRSAT